MRMCMCVIHYYVYAQANVYDIGTRKAACTLTLQQHPYAVNCKHAYTQTHPEDREYSLVSKV